MTGKSALGDFSMRLTAEVHRSRELTVALALLSAHVATLEGRIDSEWMAGLVKHLNMAMHVLGITDRYVHKRGAPLNDGECLGLDRLERMS